MKWLVFVALLFLSSAGFSQTNGFPRGNPISTSSGWITYGYIKVDSGLLVPIRTTNWRPRFDGTMILDVTGGTPILKVWYGGGFKAVGGSVTTGGTGSGNITFNGRTGPTIVPQTGDYTPDMVGLGNVANMTEAQRNAAAAILTNKTINGNNNTFANIPQAAVNNLVTALAAKADQAYVNQQVDNVLVGGIYGMVLESPLAGIRGKNNPDGTRDPDTGAIRPNAILTAHIADNAISSQKLADGAVTAGKLADLSVPETAIQAGAVTAQKLGIAAVGEENLSSVVQQKLNKEASGLQAETSLTFANISPSTAKRIVEVSNDETNGGVYTLYYHTGTALRRITTTLVALPPPQTAGDTLALTFTSTTSNTKVLYGNWNNVTAANGVNFTATNLIYKATGAASTIDVDSIYNGTMLTSTAADCLDTSMAPNTVLKYYSQAPALSSVGGRIYYFGGFNPAKTYDIVYLFPNNAASTRTLSSQGQSFTITPTTSCTNFIRLAGLVPDASGKIQVKNVGTSPTATTYVAGFYIIEH